MTTFGDMEFAERKAVVDRPSEVMEKEFEIPENDVDDFWKLIIFAVKVLELSGKVGDPAGKDLIEKLKSSVAEKIRMC